MTYIFIQIHKFFTSTTKHTLRIIVFLGEEHYSCYVPSSALILIDDKKFLHTDALIASFSIYTILPLQWSCHFLVNWFATPTASNYTSSIERINFTQGYTIQSYNVQPTKCKCKYFLFIVIQFFPIHCFSRYYLYVPTRIPNISCPWMKGNKGCKKGKFRFRIRSIQGE